MNEEMNKPDTQVAEPIAAPLAEPEIEVELASPMRRICAALLNNLFSIIAAAPLFVALIIVVYTDSADFTSGAVFGSANSIILISVGALVYLVFGIVQIYFMSRDGQSLGKKALKIRVLKTDGSNPGFVGTVLMREAVYIVLIVIAAALFGYLAEIATGSAEIFELASSLVQTAASFACFIMLFIAKNDRRTLYDYLAGTVVVKLPE